MATHNTDRPSDKSTRVGPKGPDHRLVEVEKAGEVAFWMKWFGVTEEELRRAVREVGASAHNVAAYFDELRRSR